MGHPVYGDHYQHAPFLPKVWLAEETNMPEYSVLFLAKKKILRIST